MEDVFKLFSSISSYGVSTSELSIARLFTKQLKNQLPKIQILRQVLGIYVNGDFISEYL